MHHQMQTHILQDPEVMESNISANEQRAKDLNDWLPITASREAKWWYAAFHCVTAMVGAGVLGLPLVLASLHPYPGLIAIFISWLVTLYTLWLLVNLHEAIPGKRFDRYTELARYVLGERVGNWVVMPPQLTVQIGSNIVYMVTGGKSLKKCFGLHFPKADFSETYYTLMFTGLQLILSQLPNFNSLKVISLIAALMSICYSMIATGASLVKGTSHAHQDTKYGFHSTKTAGIIFDMFSSFGALAFAFAGHSVALEIQATIPSTPSKPSKKSMWRGVFAAYVVVALCYFSVAASGFWAFGESVDADVLLSLENPKWLIAVANFMVFVHVLGSFQVFAMPIFDKIECISVQKLNLTPGRSLRLVARSSYIAITGLIAILVPFFDGLLGFFGGLVFASTSYIIPCAIWLVLHRPKRFSFHWIACWVSICIGSVITVLGPIGGARKVIVSWHTYKLFSFSTPKCKHE